MQDLSGTTIKSYELREQIGSGGFGAVYRAYQSSVRREVAVKIILPHFANHPDFIRRFETEAELVARLEHPHIIPIYDYWRDTSGAYLVMRWLRGGSLSDALKNGSYNLPAALSLLDQITSALALAHRSNIIHRDLKPANILLDEDGNAYVADFGIAKDIGSSGPGVTDVDALVGSPDYLAPEQARSEPVSPQTDIYSLGVLLYEVLTGQHPFPKLTPVERMFKHLNESLTPVTTLSPDIAVGVNALIQKATAKNPAHRYPDVLAMAAAFQEAAGVHRQPNGDTVVEALTQREQEVLQRILDGQPNKQIAQELFISLTTVKWYVNQIYGKLGVHSRVQAIVRARELKLITQGQADTSAQVVPIPTAQFAQENPYKGLWAFQSADCQDFFGREALTEKLIKRLGETGEMARFLAVVGPSGSGKSSLVKAGLIPALWRGALPGSERWFVVEMLPSARPIDELEVALTRVAANQSGNLHEQLERDTHGLLRVAQLILPNDDSQLVLVIDQFEEVFTLVEDEQARVHFLNLICEAVTDLRSRVRVVVTLRADFYDRPLLYPEFGELVRCRMETVLPLTADGLERAIAHPAERVGATFESGLVASIVSEVNYQPGALPLLQYALTELFERRQGRILTREAYQAIGGTVGALARRADEIYEGLDSKGQEAARQMFLRLVTLGEGVEDTRRRVPRSELLAIAADEDMMDDLIDTYAVYRLLSLDHDPATRSPTVEVAHEALLREWQRLRGWLNESRHDIQMQRLLAAAATEWHTANRDNSFLLQGSRLDQFQSWVTNTKLALTQKERDYLDASLAERERQTLAEQKRQLREKTLERRSRNFLWGLVAVLVVAALVGFGLAAYAISQSQAAQQNAVIADRNAAESQNVALVAGSRAALASGDTDLALALAMQAITLNPTSAPAQIAFGQAAYAPGTIRRFVGHTDLIDMASFSPDGHTALSASWDKTVILWDVQTGQIIRRMVGHTDQAVCVAFTPDGKMALSGSHDKTLILWDIQTGQIIRRLIGHTDWIFNLAISPDGRTALSVGKETSAILWDIQTGGIIRRFEGHTGPIGWVTYSPDGRRALTASWDKLVILWDVETGQIIRKLVGHEGFVEGVAFSPDGRRAFSGAQDSSSILWDLETGAIIRRFDGGQGWVEAVAYGPDGRTALSGGGDNTIIQWDLETGRIINKLLGHQAFIDSLTYSSDGRTVLSSSGDHTMRLWDLESGQIVRHYAGHKGWGPRVGISPDGQLAFSAGPDDVAILFKLQTGEIVHRLDSIGAVSTARFARDGRQVIIAVGAGFAHDSSAALLVWDVQTGQIVRRITDLPSNVNGVDISPDGRMILSVGQSSYIVLWDMETGQEIRRFHGYENSDIFNPGAAMNAEFSPDGRTALTAFGNGNIVLWDVATGQQIRRFVGHSDLTGVTFTPDGRTAFSASADRTAILWDVATGTMLHRFTDHGGAVFLGGLSPDGRLALYGSGDGTTSLWDLQTRQEIRRFTGQNANPFQVSFSPDGHSALVSLPDGGIQLWRIDTLDELVAWARANRYIPPPACDQRQLYRLSTDCDANDVTPTPTPFPATPPSVPMEAATPR